MPKGALRSAMSLPPATVDANRHMRVSLSRTYLRIAREQGRQRATERNVREGWRELVRGSDDEQGRSDRNSRRVQAGTLGVFEQAL